MINGSKTDVTDDPRFAVKFVDTNGNGIADQMQWIVPKLSEQQFLIQAQITIINVQSYPVVGGTWQVRFNTTGIANLTITTINGTKWSFSNENNDLRFLSVKCGNQTLSYKWINGSVFIPNYSCTDIGYETSKVLTVGKHHLMFRFGDSVGYANNDAAIPGFKFGKGDFTSPGASGLQSITSVGFQPKAIMFFWTNQTTADTTQGNIYAGIGFANSTQQRSVEISSDNNVATSNTSRNSTNGEVIDIQRLVTAGALPDSDALAKLVSFDTNGFTLNWDKHVSSNNYIIHYIAFGGADLTNAGVGSTTITTGAGTLADTSVGFKPDFVIFISSAEPTAQVNTAQADGLMRIGFAAANKQDSLALSTQNGQIITSVTAVRTNQSGVINGLTSSGGDDARASIKSFDPMGFTIQKDFVNTEAEWHYLALKGGEYFVGNFSKTTAGAPAPQTVSGIPFNPVGIMLTSKNKEGNATNAADTHARISFGAGNATKAGAIFFHDYNGLTLTVGNTAAY